MDSEGSDMTKQSIVVIVLIAACFLLLWRANDATSGALDRAETAEFAIIAIAAQRDSAQQRADSLVAKAQAADSLVEELRADLDDPLVVERLVVQMDTIMELVPDTTAQRLLVEREEIWQGMVDARDAVIVAQDSSISFWRASSEAKDDVIATWERQNEIRTQINDELRSALRRKNMQSWVERGGTGLAVAAVLLLTR